MAGFRFQGGMGKKDSVPYLRGLISTRGSFFEAGQFLLEQWGNKGPP